MSENEKNFPERTDLNFQDCRWVRSRKTDEDLMVLEANNTKTGELFSVWIRYDGMSKILMEIGKMLSS